MINSQPRPTSHQTTPCLSGQWLRHPKAKAREKHSYFKPGKFKTLQHDQFVNRFHSWQLRVLSCPLPFKRLLETPVIQKVKHYNIYIHIIKVHLATDATKSFNNQFYDWFEVTFWSWQCQKTSDNVTKFIFLFPDISAQAKLVSIQKCI